MNPSRSPAPSPAGPIRVLVCDDSVVIRSAISRILDAQSDIRVVARAANGQAALDALKLHDIDVVVLDIEMPVMDGLTALPLLLRAKPGLPVIMASTLTARGADISLRALRAGAADYVPKPSAIQVASDAAFGTELLAKVRGLTRIRRAPPASQQSAETVPLRPPPARAPALLAIGSSTGGPNALFTLITGLGTALPVPVIITQHMPAGFTAMLAQHIDRLGVMPCREASEGSRLVAGEILLAPGDFHMLIKRDTRGLAVQLSRAPAINFCRPSVDPMLQSACAEADGRVLVAMLTGMGADGLAGTRMVVEAGGAALVQDEATSVVWGMPGAVAKAGLAHAVLPLQHMAPRLSSLLKAAR